jgi:integrase
MTKEDFRALDRFIMAIIALAVAMAFLLPIDPASGRPITAHGFRATFRTWAEEVATVPHAVIEQAMGHQVGGQVERAYHRTDLLDQRRNLMEAWAQWCEPKADSNVIAFGKASRS